MFVKSNIYLCAGIIRVMFYTLIGQFILIFYADLVLLYKIMSQNTFCKNQVLEYSKTLLSLYIWLQYS